MEPINYLAVSQVKICAGDLLELTQYLTLSTMDGMRRGFAQARVLVQGIPVMHSSCAFFSDWLPCNQIFKECFNNLIMEQWSGPHPI